jgi:hypothetical protein
MVLDFQSNEADSWALCQPSRWCRIYLCSTKRAARRWVGDAVQERVVHGHAQDLDDDDQVWNADHACREKVRAEEQLILQQGSSKNANVSEWQNEKSKATR